MTPTKSKAIKRARQLRPSDQIECTEKTIFEADGSDRVEYVIASWKRLKDGKWEMSAHGWGETLEAAVERFERDCIANTPVVTAN